MTQESSRIIALREAVEHCRKLGMSETEVLAIRTAEVFGAARLRKAIEECQAPNKIVRMSYYEQSLDKRIENEKILATVNQVVQASS